MTTVPPQIQRTLVLFAPSGCDVEPGRAQDQEAHSERTLSGPWVAELACPAAVPIRPLIERMLALRSLTGDPAGRKPDLEIVPDVYWPAVTRALQAVLSAAEAVHLCRELCPAWVTFVIEKLLQNLKQTFVRYALQQAQADGTWPPYPLHADRCFDFDRMFFALAHLPSIDCWRPVEASQATTAEKLERLISKVVRKAFEDYQDDPDWLVWGTVESLQLQCQELLEQRRDCGYFVSWAPSRVRDIRLLANRLGCDEPGIAFEQEDCVAALARAMRGLGDPWPVEVENQVCEWLRKIIAWSLSWQTEARPLVPQAKGQTAVPEKRKRWTAKAANARAFELAKEDHRFLDLPLRDWALHIGCSTGLVSNLPLWQMLQPAKESRSRRRSAKATLVRSEILESTVADDLELSRLILEQEAETNREANMAKRQRARERS